MANYIWKPLYNYEASFFTQIGMFLGWILIIASIGIGILLFTTPAFFVGFIFILSTIVGSISNNSLARISNLIFYLLIFLIVKSKISEKTIKQQ